MFPNIKSINSLYTQLSLGTVLSFSILFFFLVYFLLFFFGGGGGGDIMYFFTIPIHSGKSILSNAEQI